MTRLAGAVGALLCLASPVAAGLDRSWLADRTGDTRLLLTQGLIPDTTEVPTPPTAELTTDTKVFLDGKSCRFQDVPATATIVRLELAEDGKTINRVEFRSKK